MVASKQAGLFENNAKSYMKTLMNKAFGVVEDLLETAEKDSVRLEAAKFVIDHVVGKAVSHHEVKGTLLVEVMNKLDSMKNVGPTLLATPVEPEYVDVATDPVVVAENAATAKQLVGPVRDAVDTFMESLDFDTSVVGVRSE